MINKIIIFSLKNKIWILGILFILMISGVLSISQLPIDAVPDITNVQVTINSKTGALDPEKIEMLVTRPIEIEMTGLSDLEEVRSLSKYGLSQVTLVFSDNTNLFIARQQVLERLQNTRKALPEKISPELAPSTTGLGEIFMYAVEAKPGSKLEDLPEIYRLTQLRTIQDYLIRPALKKLKGVADIDSNGGYQKEIHINFFPDRLDQVGLTIEQLTSRLDTLGENFGGGYIQQNGNQVIVRTVPGLSQLEDLNQIALGLNSRGRPIRLSDVAEVREDHALRVGAATRNGKETVLGTVLMRSGANSRQVAKDAESALKQIQLPEGVELVPLYSRSFLVDSTIHSVTKSLLEGAILVVVVLLLLLGNVRAALLVALAIPISMLFAIQGMLLFGISGNLMSLGAIDFGLLVDGSVVLIDSILNQIKSKKMSSELLRTDSVQRIVIQGASAVSQPIVFGLFMIMIVYVPILSLVGIEGKMFRPMAITILLALVGSLGVTIFIMPIFSELFLFKKDFSQSKRDQDEETFLFQLMKKLYILFLKKSLQRPWYVLGLAMILIILAVFILSRMGADFVPKLDERDLVVSLTRNSKMDLDSSVGQQQRAELLLTQYAEVENVFSRMGTPESATDPMGVNLADTFIILKKNQKEWKYSNKEELFSQMRNDLLALNSDQEVSATQPIEMRFNEVLEGSRADVTIRLLGFDLQKLVQGIEKLREVIQGIAGVDSVSSDPLTSLRQSPMLDLTINYDALAKYGVTISEINHLVELAMGGKEIGEFFEKGIRFPIVVHLDESLRNEVPRILGLPVALPYGGTLPLNRFIDPNLKDRVTTIARSWGERYAALSVNLRGRDVDSFVEEAKDRIQKKITLPEGSQLYWGGQFKNLNHAKQRLFIIIPVTLLIVGLILLRTLRSLGQTFLVLTSIPFGAIGGVFSLAARNIPLSVSAAVGFIALIGIALLNSLVLVHIYQSHLNFKNLIHLDLKSKIIDSSVSRLRPVMMTALVASMGFLPMAINTGIGCEVQRPLATVVIGGIVSSTLLTLVLLPVLFSLMMTQRLSKLT